MNRVFGFSLVLVFMLMNFVLGDDAADPTLDKLEDRLTTIHEGLEEHKTDENDVSPNQRWLLRSHHFLFGMPRLVDDRHDFSPENLKKQPGISVVVREGFVVAHFDRMHSPLFVCQRWMESDYRRMEKLPNQGRPWKVDLELPIYARIGTSYDGNESEMDRGHMARHELNRAWGIDNSRFGCRMSNSAPQHKDVNRGKGWRDLEDALRDVVVDEDLNIQAVWTINGTLFRDKTNPDGEPPEDDFKKTEEKLIGDGFPIPYATYKVVGWFDKNGLFQARGYVFEQDDRQAEVEKHLTVIDEIEKRAGVDFFPTLQDPIETIVESTKYSTLWDK